MSVNADDSRTKSQFRDAMACFPSGVTIVTTTDSDGRPWGFTATAFCSVSSEPPLVLACLAKSAQCHPVFQAADAWVVHVLPEAHAELAIRFATRGTDKFAGGEFTTTDGLPRMSSASATLECSVHARHDAGDHTILVGRVLDVALGTAPPAVYFDRAFHRIAR
ncbi:flavin reductase family protein [Saccharopolyspora sp. NPDC050389]|uniref:flavin reductase family protein n=1 Tax=Saccharopolyspora sp. NPDC050389 TaxID=3155516 RepID=UPI0033C4BCDA